jgi:hypothetical protein
MVGVFENVASLIDPIRELLILILGALLSLLGTLLVQSRRAKDDLRVRILSGTVARLTELEDLVAKIATQLGMGAVRPLMTLWTSTPANSEWSEELFSAVTRLKVLIHSFRRYPMLTKSVLDLVTTTEDALHTVTLGPLFPGEPTEPKQRASVLFSKQAQLAEGISSVNQLIDRIIANDLRSDRTFGARMRAAVPTSFLSLRLKSDARKE